MRGNGELRRNRGCLKKGRQIHLTQRNYENIHTVLDQSKRLQLNKEDESPGSDKNHEKKKKKGPGNPTGQEKNRYDGDSTWSVADSDDWGSEQSSPRERSVLRIIGEAEKLTEVTRKKRKGGLANGMDGP